MRLTRGIKHIFVVWHFELFFERCLVCHEGICLGVANYGSSGDTPSVRDRGVEGLRRRTPSPDAVGYCWPGFRPNFHFQCAPAVVVGGHIFDLRIHVTLPVAFFSNLNIVFQQPSNQHGSHHRSHDVNYVRPSPMLHNPASFHHSLDLVRMHPCTEQIGAVSVSRRAVPTATLYLFTWVPVTA